MTLLGERFEALVDWERWTMIVEFEDGRVKAATTGEEAAALLMPPASLLPGMPWDVRIRWAAR